MENHKAKGTPGLETRDQIIASAKSITVCDDGGFRYPVRSREFESWVAHNGKVTTTNYDKFCCEVDCIGEKAVGTVGEIGMINLCNDLIAAGAEVANLA